MAAARVTAAARFAVSADDVQTRSSLRAALNEHLLLLQSPSQTWTMKGNPRPDPNLEMVNVIEIFKLIISTKSFLEVLLFATFTELDEDPDCSARSSSRNGELSF